MNKKNTINRLIGHLAFKGLALNLLCNFTIALLFAGALYFFFESNRTLEGDFLAIMCVIGFGASFWVSTLTLQSILVDSTKLKKLFEEQFTTLNVDELSEKLVPVITKAIKDAKQSEHVETEQPLIEPEPEPNKADTQLTLKNTKINRIAVAILSKL